MKNCFHEIRNKETHVKDSSLFHIFIIKFLFRILLRFYRELQVKAPCIAMEESCLLNVWIDPNPLWLDFHAPYMYIYVSVCVDENVLISPSPLPLSSTISPFRPRKLSKKMKMQISYSILQLFGVRRVTEGNRETESQT